MTNTQECTLRSRQTLRLGLKSKSKSKSKTPLRQKPHLRRETRPRRGEGRKLPVRRQPRPYRRLQTDSPHFSAQQRPAGCMLQRNVRCLAILFLSFNTHLYIRICLSFSHYFLTCILILLMRLWREEGPLKFGIDIVQTRIVLIAVRRTP
jgi:hypothetical protein